MQTISPKLIIGLGNPSKEYEKTYHNVGFLFIDSLAKNGFKKEKSFSFAKEGKVVLVKPLVFMNESGRAVSEAVKYFSSSKNKVSPEEILIVHDDSDIFLGDHKFSLGRGSAGHRGVESIIKSLKTKDFSRLRIGIRPMDEKETKREKAGDFVLKKISPRNLKMLSEEFKEISKIINV